MLTGGKSAGEAIDAPVGAEPRMKKKSQLFSLGSNDVDNTTHVKQETAR